MIFWDKDHLDRSKLSESKQYMLETQNMTSGLCTMQVGDSKTTTESRSTHVNTTQLGLHQSTEISSTDIVDTWEPLEEGLHRLETKRSVSEITVTLSKNQLDSSSPGYQAPLPADQVCHFASLWVSAASLIVLHSSRFWRARFARAMWIPCFLLMSVLLLSDRLVFVLAAAMIMHASVAYAYR